MESYKQVLRRCNAFADDPARNELMQNEKRALWISCKYFLKLSHRN